MGLKREGVPGGGVVEITGREEGVVEITEQGRKRVEDLYASLPPDMARALKEEVGQAVREILAMSPLELYEQAYRLATGLETRQVNPES